MTDVCHRTCLCGLQGKMFANLFLDLFWGSLATDMLSCGFLEMLCVENQNNMQHCWSGLSVHWSFHFIEYNFEYLQAILI